MREKYLTAAEAAAILRVTPWSVVTFCRSGRLPATKPTGQWLIAESDLDEFIAAGSNKAAS